MEELQETAVLERGLVGSGVSLSRAEQGKNKVKIAGFSGASRWQSAESSTWISSQSGQRMGTGCQAEGLGAIPGNQLSPALLPSVEAE